MNREEKERYLASFFEKQGTLYRVVGVIDSPALCLRGVSWCEVIHRWTTERCDHVECGRFATRTVREIEQWPKPQEGIDGD